MTYAFPGLTAALDVYVSRNSEPGEVMAARAAIAQKIEAGKWSWTLGNATRLLKAVSRDVDMPSVGDLHLLLSSKRPATWRGPFLLVLFDTMQKMAWGYHDYDDFVREGAFTSFESFSDSKATLFDVAAGLIRKVHRADLDQAAAYELGRIVRMANSAEREYRDTTINLDKVLTAFGAKASPTVVKGVVSEFLSEATPNFQRYGQDKEARALQAFRSARALLKDIRLKSQVVTSNYMNRVNALIKNPHVPTSLREEAKSLRSTILQKKLKVLPKRRKATSPIPKS